MRFCGQGRKWCGKVCIDSRHVCRKAQSATIKATYAKKRAMNVRKAGFKRVR